MNLYGLDFTSAPSQKKPITRAFCELSEAQPDILHLKTLDTFPTFDGFEAFLRSDGPWLAALDFPFGQPRKLITNLGWPTSWEGYMSIIVSLSKAAFEETLRRYRESRPAGDKQHLRVTDEYAGAISPMMMHRVPVGKMFFEGATRLYRSEVSVLPCRPTGSNTIAIEGYPALVARKLIGKRSYKSDERGQQTIEKNQARQEIVAGLRGGKLTQWYGITVGMPDQLAEELLQDAMGDKLDAVLCAVQAAWAYSQRERGYGIPEECDKDEGWIVDPSGA